MIRGGSCEFRWNLPYNFSELAIVKITFWQDNYNGPTSDRTLPITKVREQCRVGSKPTELSVTLNQEETLRFTDKRKGNVQLAAKTTTGIPIVSKEALFPVYPICNDSILDDTVIPAPDYDELILLDGKNII